MPKPFLFLDVDGPLNPFDAITKRSFVEPRTEWGEEPFDWALHTLNPKGWEEDGLPVLLAPSMGEELIALQDVFTLVWATTWEHEANTMIGPILGLPELPVIDWPDGTNAGRTGGLLSAYHRGSWKTGHLAKWIDENGFGPGGPNPTPWVWVDDEIRRPDRAHLQYHWSENPGDSPRVPRWLLMTSPNRGLLRSDFRRLRAWAVEHGTP